MRLIDAEELMKRICEYECGMRPEDCDGMESKTVPCNHYSYVSEMPTVDAVPVKRGKWEDREVRGSISPYCTNCGNGIDTIYHYDYCPNCGAKMNGGA